MVVCREKSSLAPYSRPLIPLFPLIVMAGVAYAQFAGRRVEEAEEQIDSA